MKILLDIGHPAHVHYFRNAIKSLQQKGHQFLITTRDKEVTLDLLRNYNLPFVCTGKNKKGIWKKFLSMLRNNVIIFWKARIFGPDLFISFFSPFAAQVGWILKKPVIGFTDTEFAKFSICLTKPFTNYIFTPHCFTSHLGKNHFRFNGYMESFYLHPNYFSPDPTVLSKLGVKKGEFFTVLRFVSFNAGHDSGESGIEEIYKLKIASRLLEKGKLFISSESEMTDELKQYKLDIPPSQFHNILAHASLYVGEGITTASECAQLGTPAVLINTLSTGYIDEQVKLGLVYRFDDAQTAFPKISEILENEDPREMIRSKKESMLAKNVDCTAFLIWLIDEFPASVESLKKNKESGITSKNFSILTSR